MYIRRAALAAAILLLLGGGLGEGAASKDRGQLDPPARPVRAVQVLRFECGSWEDLERRLDEFKAANVETVIVRVFHNPGDGFYGFIEPGAQTGVYFRSEHAPVVADALGPIIERAHARGLKVVAWMTTRYADYGHEDEAALHCMGWDFGKKQAVVSRGYSPFLPEVQERLAAIYRDLAAYPIDGVLLQDDLVVRHLEDFNPAVTALYMEETGREATPEKFYRDVKKSGDRWRVGSYTEDYYEWRRWQNRGLLGLAERLRGAVRERRPGTPVGLNLYYETLTDPVHGLEWYAQDLDAALASDLDFCALMLYQNQMGKELGLSPARVSDLIESSLAGLIARVDRPERLWVKLQSADWDTGAALPSADLSDLLIRIRSLGPVGLVLVPAKKNLDLKMIKNAYGEPDPLP